MNRTLSLRKPEEQKVKMTMASVFDTRLGRHVTVFAPGVLVDKKTRVSRNVFDSIASK